LRGQIRAWRKAIFLLGDLDGDSSIVDRRVSRRQTVDLSATISSNRSFVHIDERPRR